MRRRRTDGDAGRSDRRTGVRRSGWLLGIPVLLGGVFIPAHDIGPARLDGGAIEGRTPVVATEPPVGDLLDDAEEWAKAVEAEALDVEAFYYEEVEPLIRSLIRLRDDREHATRIAVALVREGLKADIDPRLLLAVMTVENPWLDLAIESPVGAVGLMQVMPFHAGAWGCGGDDLTDLDVNICHGTKILAAALKRSGGDLDTALLAYNGCVHGTNTPDCHLYPSWVLRHVGPMRPNWPLAPQALTAAAVDMDD